MTIGRIASVFALTVTLMLPGWSQPTNREAWKLLLDNHPKEARDAFRLNQDSKDARTAGEACRGLAVIARFMGDNLEEIRQSLTSFRKDKDTLAFMAGQLRHMKFGDNWGASNIKDVYSLGQEFAARPTMLTAPVVFEYSRRLLNDGDIAKAEKLVADKGVLRQWYVIGPFSNISGSGFDRAYAPESSVVLNQSYAGKKGDQVRWFPLEIPPPAVWLSIHNHLPAANAIIYFAAQVESPVERQAYLSFGASASFKVFLNDRLVLADRVYRNTGPDVFAQSVTLHRGANRILIKLGNEDRYSNFLLRFMDADGKGIPDLKQVKPEGKYGQDTGSVPDLHSMPSFDREMTYLRNRLAKDPEDEDAALLTIDLCNVHELTDSGENFALKRLEKHPNSALWQSLLGETLTRSRQDTRSQEYFKAAFRNSPLCAIGWYHELTRMFSNAGGEAVLDFIAKSPDEFKNGKQALLASLAKLGQLGRRDEMLKEFARLEAWPDRDEEVAMVLAGVYKGQGKKDDALKVWKTILEHTRSHYANHQHLADLLVQTGDVGAAIDVIQDATRYLPDHSGLYLTMANLALHQKKYSDATRYTEAGLKLAPYSPVLLGLKGTIQALVGDAAGAKSVLKQSVASNYNDFPSWDKLLQLDGHPSFESLAPLPTIDSLIKASQGWEGLKRDRGAILSYIEDVFFYPSRAVRHREFLAVALPTQEAVNNWKQYSVPFNGSYQTLGITRAFSHKAAGNEVDAEISGRTLVFKSLEPGDFIVMEWTLKDDYDGEMARQVWGEFDFRLGVPTFDSRLRLYMAGSGASDTIGYTVRGSGIAKENFLKSGVQIRTFNRGPYLVPASERFLPVTDETSPDVIYSTFPDWSKISDWYANLTENKTAPAPILRKLADSLFAGIPSGASSDSERIARVQRYVSGTIAYSSLPFRQSGWVPQNAQEVLASRLGDCKDMAALAKSLLDLIGLESHLVLVATRDQFGPRAGPVGPHFNHCILAYMLAGRERYMDLTDPNNFWRRLPKGDQGAVALVIRRGNRNLINLPVDAPADRRIDRQVAIKLSDSGSVSINAQTKRTGLFGRGQRAGFRFLPEEERRKEMTRALSEDYPEVTLDSLKFADLEPTSDTVSYRYVFHSNQAVKATGATHIFNMYLPDKISNGDVPEEDKRSSGLDLYSTWFDVGTMNARGTVEFPKNWKLINPPASVRLKTPFGDYAMEFKAKGNILTYSRTAEFRIAAPVSVKEAPKLRTFLSQIAREDDVQLVFMEKGK